MSVSLMHRGSPRPGCMFADRAGASSDVGARCSAAFRDSAAPCARRGGSCPRCPRPVRHSGGVMTTLVLRRLPVTLAALAALLGVTAGSCESPTPPAAPSPPAVTLVPSDQDDVTDNTTDDGPDDTPDDGDATDDPGEDAPDDAPDDSSDGPAESGNG